MWKIGTAEIILSFVKNQETCEYCFRSPKNYEQKESKVIVKKELYGDRHGQQVSASRSLGAKNGEI